jgi:hypothetical protein
MILKPIFRRGVHLLTGEKLFLLLPALLCALMTGCSKHSEPESVPTSTASPSAAMEAKAESAPPVRARNVAAVTVPQADPSAMLGKLTEVVRRYSVEHRQVPPSLETVVAAGYLTGLPTAPAGKKFAIDKKTLQVTLQNN